MSRDGRLFIGVIGEMLGIIEWCQQQCTCTLQSMPIHISSNQNTFPPTYATDGRGASSLLN